jgi:hypothetical protein
MTNAQTFHRNEFQKLRPPTERKVINAARKAGLVDTVGELVYWLGAYVADKKLREFTQAPVAQPIRQHPRPTHYQHLMDES